jgi:hypothetical protein
MLLRPVAVAFAVALLGTAPGRAGSLYVAGYGTGTACSANSPCNSIQLAINNAGTGDGIYCVTPPLPSGGLYITKSITIDCATARAAVRDGGTNNGTGLYDVVLINLPTSDSQQTVSLRGLDIDGIRSIDRGIEIQAAAAVFIEDCVISNVSKQGIYDHRTGGQTKLFVKNTVINGNGGPGIVATSAAPGVMVLDNVSLLNNTYGLATASGNNVTLKNSTISGNTQAGVEADGGAQVTVENSTITNNNIGALVGGTVRLLRNNISFNNQAVSGSAISLGGNVYSGNAAIGATPPLASGASGDVYN